MQRGNQKHYLRMSAPILPYLIHLVEFVQALGQSSGVYPFCSFSLSLYKKGNRDAMALEDAPHSASGAPALRALPVFRVHSRALGVQDDTGAPDMPPESGRGSSP